MDLERYYDKYWQEKDEGVDPERLNYILSQVKAGDSVLDLGCGPGKVTHEIETKGAKVVGLDFSEVILKRARQRNVRAIKADMDNGGLPFKDGTFDLVVLTQTIEHLFYYQRVIKEINRVLKTGGRFILSIPNIAHWRFRLWLLWGRFPYLEDTQTHFQHIRFFTLKDTKRLCGENGFSTIEVKGSSALSWCPLYYWRMNMPPLRQIYELATRCWPALFAFHISLLCHKT